MQLWAGAGCGSDFDWLPLCLVVSLELGDVSLVSVPCEGLQPVPDGNSRSQLLAQLQELLHHWVLWAAVKSRWVIVGECPIRFLKAGTSYPAPACHPPSPLKTGKEPWERSDSQRPG